MTHPFNELLTPFYCVTRQYYTISPKNRTYPHILFTMKKHNDKRKYIDDKSFLCLINESFTDPFYPENNTSEQSIKIIESASYYDFRLMLRNTDELLKTYHCELFQFRDLKLLEKIRNFKELSEKEQVKVILTHKDTIRFVVNPSESILLAHAMKFKL